MELYLNFLQEFLSADNIQYCNVRYLAVHARNSSPGHSDESCEMPADIFGLLIYISELEDSEYPDYKY